MSPIPPYTPVGDSGPIVAEDFMAGRQLFSSAGQIDQAAGEVVLIIGGGFNITLPAGSVDPAGADAGLRFFVVNKGGSDATLVLDDPPNEQINGVVGGTHVVPAGQTHLVVQYTNGSWEAVDIDDDSVAPHDAIYDHFQSASYYTGTGILAAGEIAAGQQGNVQYLTPNGAASWSNGVSNPSADYSALLAVEVHLPAISVTPPVDGTLFSVRRVAILTFDGESDVYAYTARNVQHDAAHGAFYVPKAVLKVNRAVAAGFSGSAVINDDLTAWWEDSGGTLDLPVYAQVERGHGYVSGRVAVP